MHQAAGGVKAASFEIPPRTAARHGRSVALGQRDLAALLVFGDVATAGIVALTAPLLWGLFDHSYTPTPDLPVWQVASTLLWIVTLRLFAGRDIGVPRFGNRSIAAVVQTAVAMSAVTFGLFYFAPFYAPRGSTLLGLPLTAAAILVWRYGYMALVRSRMIERRVAIFGLDEAARRAALAIREANGGVPYEIVAFLTHEQAGSERVLGIPVIRIEDNDVWPVASQLGIHQLIVGGGARTLPPPLLAQLARCFEHGVEATTARTVYEELTGRVMVAALEADWYAELPTHLHAFDVLAKRATDLVFALVVGVVTLPLLAIAALAVIIEDGGPVIFRQVRVGQRGEHFVLHKIRSMRKDAEADGRPVWASERDTRITRVGGILRRTRIDELPQLWDVLRGRMSLIGPRPERPEFVELLTLELPLYAARALVRPGLTGWAQVHLPYAGSVDTNLAKLEYDIYYIRRLSLLLDLSIALRTLAVVFGLKGR